MNFETYKSTKGKQNSFIRIYYDEFLISFAFIIFVNFQGLLTIESRIVDRASIVRNNFFPKGHNDNHQEQGNPSFTEFK